MMQVLGELVFKWEEGMLQHGVYFGKKKLHRFNAQKLQDLFENQYQD